jgi:hypothetical protein
VAVCHLGRALRMANGTAEVLELTAELANTFAVQRDSRSLGHARRLYARGLARLVEMPDGAARLRLGIVMLNGLALVEYHEGDNQAALTLEERAENLADQLASVDPTLGRWAYSLVGVNTAKLLASRFDDRAGARKKLEDALALTVADHHAELVRRSLGQMYFDDGDFTGVIDVLAPMYPPGQQSRNEAEEFHDRLLLTVSQLAVDAPVSCAAQVPRLERLARRVGTDAAASSVALIRSELIRVGRSTCNSAAFHQVHQEAQRGV